jgi:ubiquinone/menaquinone biosynthesis C-methylase UbiE
LPSSLGEHAAPQPGKLFAHFAAGVHNVRTHCRETCVSLQHWEVYYRHGGLASCPMGPESSYTLELRDAWLEFFASLADGARILDVGTGNGAIALIAKESASAGGKAFEIHGTDLAQIDPVRHVKNGTELFAGISFRAGVPTEKLPFEPGSFDAVSGQYALEYTTIDAALREICRVLGRGGVAQFILHHEQSVIVRNARESLSQSSLVLDETQILRKLRRYIEAERRSASTAGVTWKALAEAGLRLQAATRGPVTAHTLRVTLDAVQKMLEARKQLSPAVMDREIEGFEKELRASTTRLHDVVNSAKSADEMGAIAAAARDVGFANGTIQLQQHAGSNLVGWRLNLAKSN